MPRQNDVKPLSQSGSGLLRLPKCISIIKGQKPLPYTKEIVNRATFIRFCDLHRMVHGFRVSTVCEGKLAIQMIIVPDGSGIRLS